MSPENCKTCAERGLWDVQRVTCFIKEAKPGDLLLFHVAGRKIVGDVWVIETSAFESYERVWPDKAYLLRVNDLSTA
ncbi:MAG: hypothetical protein DRJ67_10290 [Thermoprotei archaeon]|nr:MAG: hypothetical protein DRJ67_10290 [Thermoprotei archaeon]